MSTQKRLEFERIGKKQRTHMMMSPELVGVLRDHLDRRGTSSYVERAVWRALVEDMGVDDLKGAVDEQQAALDDDERLENPKRVDLQS